MPDRSTPAPVSARPEGPATETPATTTHATETHNAEQDKRNEQAQDVAVDARKEENAKAGGTESRKAPSPGVDNVAGHETDLIDVMRKMENTGEIDNSAFSGEPDHDDEPRRYHDSGIKAGEDPDDADLNRLHETKQP